MSRFLVNGTPNLIIVWQLVKVLSRVVSDNVLAQPSVLFSIR